MMAGGLSEEQWLALTRAELHRATHVLYGVLAEELASVVRGFIRESLSGRLYLFPEGVDWVSGRVVRGYNLEGCPYVALDFPSFARGGDVLILRVLVWFGVAVCVCIIGEGSPAGVIERGLRRLGEYLPAGVVVHAGERVWRWQRGAGVLLKDWLTATAPQNIEKIRVSFYEQVEEAVRLSEVVRRAVPWLIAVLEVGQTTERMNSARASRQ